MALINEAEERFPVSEWTWNGIHVWPYVRIRLNYDLIRLSQAKYVVSRRDGWVRRTMRHAEYMVGGLAGHLRAKWRDAEMSDVVHPADVLFLSDGVSFSQERGKWLERFCEPIAEQLRRDNVSGLLLTPLHHYYIPRNAPSVYIQSSLDAAAAYGLLAFRASQRAANWSLEGYEELPVWLNQRTNGASLCGKKWLKRSMIIVDAITKRFVDLIQKVRPRLVMQVSYYSTIGMACNVACRKLGVPVFDIQHGVQGELHVAYGRWRNVPETGYAMLPRYFWCWSQDEAETIHRWAGAHSRRHQALVGGNPYLAMWRKGDSQIVSECDRHLKSIMPAQRRRVLVTLQFGFATETELGNLLEAIRQTINECDWWVRFHPTMEMDEREEASRLFMSAGLSREHLDLPSSLPLYALLRHVDVHVTHSSSTVIEASHFGVPSVIVSAFGAELFPAYIRSGVAYLASGAKAIVEALRCSERRAVTNEASYALGEEAWRTCRQILSMTS